MADRAVAEKKDAAHPIAPVGVNHAAKEPGRTLKVVAFNGKGGGRLKAVIECLKGEPVANADIILFCEADWNHVRAKWRKFADEVAASLNMSFV